jgi:hypothetical protein
MIGDILPARWLGIFYLLDSWGYFTCSTACREDPLGLPSAEWVQSNHPIRMGICLYKSMRLTEDPAGHPYKLSKRINWIFGLEKSKKST